MNETLKIATVTLIVLTASLGIIFSYVYAFESGFLSRTYYEKQSIGAELAEQKIVIIGSSQVAILKPTEISNLLSNEKNGVYNLFKNADLPTKRLESVHEILEINPNLVLYGVGLNSLGYGNMNNISEDKKCIKISNNEISKKSEEVIIAKSNIIGYEQDESSQNIFEKEFFKTINPKQLTIEIIKKINFRTNEPDNQNTIEDVIKEKKSIEDLERIDSKDFGMCIDRYENGYNALRAIVEILKQEGIEVVLFIPPYDVEYFTYMPENVENSLRNTIFAVAEEKNVKVYDLTHEFDGLDIFQDITHMEEKYASKYYLPIISIINKNILN
jgi:hypothetical protein